jgi:hypothetical protein
MNKSLTGKGEPVSAELLLSNLFERHSGLTKSISDGYNEAARVCLDRHHKPPIEININGVDKTYSATLRWSESDERTRAAWNNEIDATEQGAYCVVLAAVEFADGLVALRRAETGTGADYYVAPIAAQAEDLESWWRLEVSGVDKGTMAAVQKRLKQKVDQASRGKSNLPAIAAVVGFSCRCVSIQRVG